jgi:hypothetical protein
MGKKPATNYSRSPFDWLVLDDRNRAGTFRPSHDKSFGEDMVHQSVARSDKRYNRLKLVSGCLLKPRFGIELAIVAPDWAPEESVRHEMRAVARQHGFTNNRL